MLITMEKNSISYIEIQYEKNYNKNLPKTVFQFKHNKLSFSKFKMTDSNFHVFEISHNEISNSSFHFSLIACSIIFDNNNFTSKTNQLTFKNYRECANYSKKLSITNNIFNKTSSSIKVQFLNSSVLIGDNRFYNVLSSGSLIELRNVITSTNYAKTSSVKIQKNKVLYSQCSFIIDANAQQTENLNFEISKNIFQKNYISQETVLIHGGLQPKINFNVFSNWNRYGRYFNYEIHFGLAIGLHNTMTFPRVNATYNYFSVNNPYDKVYDSHKQGLRPKAQLSPTYIDSNLRKTMDISEPKSTFNAFRGRYDSNIEFFGKIKIVDHVVINGNVLIRDPNCEIRIEPEKELIINGNLEINGFGKTIKISSTSFKGSVKYQGRIKVLNGFAKLKNVDLRETFIAFYWNSKIDIETISCYDNLLCLYFYQINHKSIQLNQITFFDGFSGFRGLNEKWEEIEFFHSYNISINNSKRISQIRFINDYVHSDMIVFLSPTIYYGTKVKYLKENEDLIYRPAYQSRFQLRAPKGFMIVIYFSTSYSNDSIFDDVAQKFIHFKVCFCCFFFFIFDLILNLI